MQEPHRQNPTTIDREPSAPATGLRIFVVAGEHSGDALGGKLMHALNAMFETAITYHGVGGENMNREGLKSLFPLDDVAVMGSLSILKRFPRIARRVYQTIDAAIDFNPDVVVIIDSPEFTHPIAKRIRKRASQIPVVNYVSPSIWAWRSGRARKMKLYVDHVLALLPFEPAAHVKHGGPKCTYVGHPLADRQNWIDGLDPGELTQRLGLSSEATILTVLPGSRASEVKHLMAPFGGAIANLLERGHDLSVIIPVVGNLRPQIEQHVKNWKVKPHFVESIDDKFKAFKASKAALAASGTVTLELAMAGAPMVVAYKVDALSAHLRILLDVHSIVLANLVLGENAFPEYLQEACNPEPIADAVELLLKETPERAAQLDALKRIPAAMAFSGASPSDHAAQIVRSYAQKHHVR